MKKTESDLDELKTLQREAAKLRSQRKGSGTSARSAAPKQPLTEPLTEAEAEAAAPPEDQRVDEAPLPPRKRTKAGQVGRKKSRATVNKKSPAQADPGEPEKPPTQASGDEQTPTGTEETINDLATQIGGFVTEMEAAAKQRPAVALLAAFTIGIVVGQLFSRSRG